MIAIKVNNLSKIFKLYGSSSKRALEYLTFGKKNYHTDFWALSDISFEIPKGTTTGIIGQNGSGKSTLLSILAGVLQPSSGTFEVNGKVSAILELGSGFHQEFSGRDNVYMYGSIMGLSKEEIDGKFEEILHFSELKDFIDRPLRTYSSGMIVRLAFSVAVNVNSDILIVDEALAVGDAIFQHRCFRKIREMQENGKTILYVGHDTDIVRNLCSYAILLDYGRIIKQGNSNEVVKKYNALIAERERNYYEVNIQHLKPPVESNNKKPDQEDENWLKSQNEYARYGNKKAEIIKLDILDGNGNHKSVFNSGELSIIRVQILLNEDIDSDLTAGYVIRNKYGDVYGLSTKMIDLDFGKKEKKEIVNIEFKQHLNLGAGIYSVTNGVSIVHSDNDYEILDRYEDWAIFRVEKDKKNWGFADLDTIIKVY